MARTKKKQTSEIPWGKCVSPKGTALMEAIQQLNVEAVRSAIKAFSDEERSRINECKLYGSFTRSKEEEDAHEEALPPLCVLAETEGKQGNDGTGDWKQAVSEIAQELLQAGADPAVRGNYISAVMMAVECQAVETTRCILHHLKQDGKTVSGGPAMIGKPRQNGTYGGHGTDVFFAASKSSNPNMLPLVFDLLKDELSNDSSNDYKFALGRLLDVACIYKSISNVNFLLEKGASPEGIHFDKKEDWCEWKRPLHSACNQGNPEIVQALLDAGASIHTRCVNGLSFVGGPIHFACGGTVGGEDGDKVGAMERRIETVRCLLKAGCDVNQPSIMVRKTPLEHAIRAGSCDMIRFLIVEALCDVGGGKDYERQARQHKKKSVARAFERSLQELQSNGGESRPVKLRRVDNSAAATQELEMIEFPRAAGSAWTWDGKEDMFPSSVQFHPQLGLFNGEEHLQSLKQVHYSSVLESSDTLEEGDDDNHGGGGTVSAVRLAKKLGELMKDESLQSETDSAWSPFWVLSTSSTTDADRKPAARPSRRSRRGGPSVEDCVKPMFQKLVGEEHDDELTIQIVEFPELGDVLEVGKRSPALKGFSSTLREAGADKAVSITINGGVVFPIFVGCILGQDDPCLAGVYSYRVET